MYSPTWQRNSGLTGNITPNHVDMLLVTPPAVEPVNLTMLKLQARYPFNDMDALFAGVFIPSARELVESYLRRALITQTWDIVFDWGPAWVELPKPPIQSVTGVYTTGLDNIETTVDPSVYFVNTTHRLISLNVGQVWPLHRGKAGFRIRFVCGYGPNPSDVPGDIRRWILSLAASMDDQRDKPDLPSSVRTALRPYRILGEPFRFARGMSREDILG